MSDQQNPDTIVLIHGFWVTPRSWEHWKSRYEAKGFTVHTPAYPGFEVEVEALRADPTPIADLTIEAIVTHLEKFLASLDTQPILMGHSAGGAFMQVVMDHGYGCAGVGLNSAPTEGVRITPWTQLHSVFPVLKNPLNHNKAVGFDADQWKYVFTNTYSDEESLAFYERYHIPASGRCCSTRCWPTSNPATRTPGSTSRTPTGPRCCSCRAPRTTSCLPRCRPRTPSTTRARAPSPSTRRTTADRT